MRLMPKYRRYAATTSSLFNVRSVRSPSTVVMRRFPLTVTRPSGVATEHETLPVNGEAGLCEWYHAMASKSVSLRGFGSSRYAAAPSKYTSRSP